MKLGNTKVYKEVVQKGLIQCFLWSLLFLGAFIPLDVIAQEDEELSSLRVVGEAKIATGEIIADRDDNRDVNGILTAGLRISSDLTGFTFESNNGIHKSQPKPGATLLYLSPNERVVTIYKEGYPRFQLVLASENIDLESGVVWEVQITGDQKASSAPVQFNVTPENSTIFIDGEEFQINGTVFERELAEGSHIIQLRKPQHEFVDDSITVSSERVNTHTYELQEINPIPVTINSTPEGASIYLNDEPGSRGTTPHRVNIYPGDLKVELRLQGYSTLSDELEYEESIGDLNYNLQEFIGFFSVNTEPENAVLLIDDQIQSQKSGIRLIPGPHRIEVRATGYDPKNMNINIQQGDSLTETITLDEITGNLYLIAQQEDANFTLRKNGEIVEKWQGSRTLRNLPVGSYQLNADLNNFLSKTETFELVRNADHTIDVDLEQIDGVGYYKITGVFEDAEVQVRGRRYTKNFDKLPVEIESLPFGNYEITVSKDGFKTYTTNVDFNNFSGSMNLVDEFVPKTKGKALFRSLFIPGTGHGYLDKGGRGFLYFLGSAAAIGYTVKSYLDYKDNISIYNTAKNRYNTSTTGNFQTYWDDYQNSYQDVLNTREQIELGLTVLAAVKGLETLDLLLQRSNKRLLKKAKLNFSPANSGISMRINF